MSDSTLHQLEEFFGFPIDQKEITLEMDEPHNEAISYALCQRFYGDKEGNKKAIYLLTSAILSYEKNAKSADERQHLALLYSTLGNLYYLLHNFDKSVGCFMKSLSYNRENLTYWVELMFVIRSLGEFDLFEDMIFSVEKIYVFWQKNQEKEMGKIVLLGLIKEAKS